MKYLTLAADYGEVAIRDERAGALRLEELSLPASLASAITDWNGRYQPVIPADEGARRGEPMASLIRGLDVEGCRLARRIAEALDDEANVRYYREGLLKEVM